MQFVPINGSVREIIDELYAKGIIEYLPQIRPYTRNGIGAFLGKNTIPPIIDTTSQRDLCYCADDPFSIVQRALAEDRAAGFRLGAVWDNGKSGISIANRIEAMTAVDFSQTRDMSTDGSWIMDLGINLGGFIYAGTEQDFNLALFSWSEFPSNEILRPLRPDMGLYTLFLTSGQSDFNHAMVHTPGELDLMLTGATKMQFNIELPVGLMSVGRQSLDWGPSNFANLALSGTSKPYEYINYYFNLGGKGTFAWMTGVLQPYGFNHDPGSASDNHLVTAHRLEYQVLPWLLLAIQESVVYNYRFELAYLNPLSLYYIAEVNKGDNDNKLGGVDIVLRLPPTKLYLSLFADDWDLGQAFRFDYYHNICGLVLGVNNYSFPDIRLDAEYVYLSHWMYTHWVPGQQYEHWDSHLGHPLEPNSHMLRIAFDYRANPLFDFSATTWVMQRGRGDIDTPAVWDDEAALYGLENFRQLFYSFLDAELPGIVIETNLHLGVGITYNIPQIPVKMKFDYALEYSLNDGRQSGINLWNNYMSFSIVMRNP